MLTHRKSLEENRLAENTGWSQGLLQDRQENSSTGWLGYSEEHMAGYCHSHSSETQGLWKSTGPSGPENEGCFKWRSVTARGFFLKMPCDICNQGESPARSNPASAMFGVYEYKRLDWGHLFLAPTVQSKGAEFGTRILKSILKEQRKLWEKNCDEIHFTQVPNKRL